LNLQDTFGNPVGSIEITYENFVYRTQTAFAYYTGDWVCISQATKSCYTPSNWCGATCDQMQANNSNAAGQLSDPLVTTCPGVTKCTRTCGCAGCGCFYCNAACTPFRWALNPVGPSFSVYQVTGLTAIPTINITVKGLVNTSYQIFPFPGVLTQAGVMNFTQQGLYQTPLNLNIGSYGVINQGNNIYFGPVSSRGTPTKNSVGDIQYYNLVQRTCSLTTGSLNSLFDTSIGEAGATSVTCSRPGINLLNSVPNVFNGYTLNTIFGSSSAVDLTPPVFPPVQLSFTSANITLQQIVDFVCPEIEALNITGCYDCPLGYITYFKARSKCAIGPALVTSENCIPQTISLLSSEAVYSVQCFSNESSISDTLNLIGGSKSASCSSTGVLNAPDQSAGIFGNSSSSTPSDTSIGFSFGFMTNSILGLSTSLSSTWKFVLNIICLFAILVLTILGIKYLFPLIYSLIVVNKPKIQWSKLIKSKEQADKENDLLEQFQISARDNVKPSLSRIESQTVTRKPIPKWKPKPAQGTLTSPQISLDKRYLSGVDLNPGSTWWEKLFNMQKEGYSLDEIRRLHQN
jgi:hypothetical protein